MKPANQPPHSQTHPSFSLILATSLALECAENLRAYTALCDSPTHAQLPQAKTQYESEDG